MIEVHNLTKTMDATMKDMETYLGMAMDSKYDELSEQYFELYLHHKDDYMDLHKTVVKFINEVAKGKSNVSEETLKVMQSMWNWQHEQQVERFANIESKEKLYTQMKK